MRCARLVLAAALMATPALAQDPTTSPGTDAPLTAEAFDALTRGKTMDTHDAELGLYGVEIFLPGQRVYWKDSSRCIAGTWEQVGPQICFTYEDQVESPVCWVYVDQGDHIMGWLNGDRDTVPIQLFQGGEPFSCDGFIGA